jgi:hypothetical protein
MDDSGVPVWKNSRSKILPEGGSVWAGRLRAFRKVSNKDTSAYDGRIGSYLLVITDVGDMTFEYTSYECDGQSVRIIKANQRGALAILADLIENDFLELIPECRKEDIESECKK